MIRFSHFHFIDVHCGRELLQQEEISPLFPDLPLIIADPNFDLFCDDPSLEVEDSCHPLISERLYRLAGAEEEGNTVAKIAGNVIVWIDGGLL